ncbi:MAG: T9SS type A sorting domain-containing protein, partial [Bacteroidia bacterium]|nr:T9SS type A sorting domain-containing protein [Bacteroidia bacterium]
VTASGQTLNQPSTITIPLTVDQAPGGNCCFSFNPPSSCGSLAVTYQGLIDLSPNQPTSYNWDFGNGQTSTLKNPPVQNYTTPGQYYPHLVTTVSNYVLTDISVTASGTNWCGDVEEISLFGACQGSPDIYYTFTNGSTSFQSSAGSNSTAQTWTNLNHVLSNPIMSLQFWDDDGTSPDDNLGVYATNITAPGVYNFTTSVNGNQETFGTFTISLVTDTIFDTTDTVEVYANPPMPTLTASPNDSACLGDSILLSTSLTGPYSYQWFQSSTLISDSIATYISATGYYMLNVVDTVHICATMSDSILFSFVNYPQAPVIVVDNTTGDLQVTNNSGNYQVEWFNNGVLIPGTSGNILSGQTTSGPYTAKFTNSVGCSAESFPFTLCLSGTVMPPANDTLCCGELEDFMSQGFVTSQGFMTAWAVTPVSFGPITNAQDVADADAAGYVYLPTTDSTLSFTRLCYNLSDSIAEGDYYVTPFIVEDVTVPDPIVWDTLQGCRPHAFMCPVLSGETGWSLNPMVFTFPDGSQLNVNQSVAAGLSINQGLIDALGGLPCIDLMNLYLGNPNGPWSISTTNNGTGNLHVEVPAFQVINYADSCNLITQDQVYTIAGISLDIAPGETQSVNINIPPIPGGFPSVQDACSGFADPILIHYVNCYPALTCNLQADSLQGSNVTTIGGTNGFCDVEISGGTPPYSLLWNTGSSNEDLFNVAAGTYTLVATDANQCSDTLVVVISEQVGIQDLGKSNSFALLQNVPNPAENYTDIHFVAPTAGNFTLTISGLEGKVISQTEIQSKSGLNTFRLDTKAYPAGVYMYTVGNGKELKASHRMLIQK